MAENLRQDLIVAQRQALNEAIVEHAATLGSRRPLSANKMAHAYHRIDDPLTKILGLLTRDELVDQLASIMHSTITIAYREGTNA